MMTNWSSVFFFPSLLCPFCCRITYLQDSAFCFIVWLNESHFTSSTDLRNARNGKRDYFSTFDAKLGRVYGCKVYLPTRMS